MMWAEGQQVQEANVSPSSNGNVTFTGIACCDIAAGGDIEQVKYSLFANAEGWQTSVVPNEILFTPGQEGFPFYVNVSVPIGTSYYTSRTLYVNGIATIFPDNITYNLGLISGTIKIKQYYEYAISSMETNLDVDRGKKVIYNLSITNMGNGRDKFQLEIRNLIEQKKSGLNLNFQDSFELDSNTSKYIDVLIEISDSTKPRKYEIEFMLKSQQEELNEGFSVTENLTLIINVEDEVEDEYDLHSIFIGFIILVLIILAIIFIKMRKSNK